MTTSNLGLEKLLTSSKGVTLAPRGPTVACDGIFCSVGKDLWHSANAWPRILVLKNCSSKEKNFLS